MNSTAPTLSAEPNQSKQMSKTISSSVPVVTDETAIAQMVQVAVTLQVPVPGGRLPPPPGTHRIEIKIIPIEE